MPEDTIPHNELVVRHLTRRDILTSFDSGQGYEELDGFLKDDARSSQENLISRTYLCFWKNNLVGFITLVTDTIELKAVEDGDQVDGYKHPKYPAIKIARLSVDKRFRKRGIGSFLLLWSIGKFNQITKQVGCRYITVDSKPQSIGFYEKYKFKLVKKYKDRDFPPMYLNAYPIISAMEPHETLNLDESD